jgi:hypothetical protein
VSAKVNEQAENVWAMTQFVQKNEPHIGSFPAVIIPATRTSVYVLVRGGLKMAITTHNILSKHVGRITKNVAAKNSPLNTKRIDTNSRKELNSVVIPGCGECKEIHSEDKSEHDVRRSENASSTINNLLSSTSFILACGGPPRRRTLASFSTSNVVLTIEAQLVISKDPLLLLL